ncbi:MAG TPA: S41 family peptidase [Candidatus Acidoferrales bacterium]|nr:S41 family peptidase [Candidatus Acidoferrales bacterium]
MNRPIKIGIVLLSLIVFSYAALGYVLKSDDQQSYRALGVYSEVLEKVQEDYVEEPNIPKATTGALHGLLESLDAMSSYMSPQEYAEFKKNAAEKPAGQIGAVLSKRFGYVMVVSTLPGGPAEKGGLLPGDIVEAISGLTTREMSTEQAAQMLSGAPGTVVKVDVVSRGRGQTQTETEDVTRAAFSAVHIVVTKLGQDIAYIRIPTLDAGKTDELRAKLVELDRDGVHKVILDVRGCALGEISEGISATRLFLPSGTITSLRGQTVSKQEFSADASKVVWKNPVTVLTSGATSGAAEILAAAIGGNHRGEVVGERTFGSASQQKLIQLEDGAAVNITVAYYYTPGDKQIPEEGVSPTTEVTTTADDPVVYSHAENPPLTPGDPKNDPVLGKALELFNGGQKSAERRAPLRRVFSHFPTTS